MNFKLLKCIYLLFDTKNIHKNFANYMLIFLFILSIIAIIIFSCHNYKKIKKVFKSIIKERLKKRSKNSEQNNIDTENENRNIYHIKNQKNSSNTSKTGDSGLFSERKNISNNMAQKWLKDKINQEGNTGIKINIFENNQIINYNIRNSKKYSFKKFKHNELSKHINLKNSFIRQRSIGKNSSSLNKINESNKYNDNEINLLSYKTAKKHDKRTYIQYYISLLKTKHLLFFSFCNSNDYNSSAIKIYIFFFTIQIEYTISAVFYTDDAMHKIYEDEGTFDIIYQMPQMLYSSLLSLIITNLICNLGLYEDNVLTIKNCKFIKLSKNVKREKKCIKTKIILFFIVTYILLICFWLYVGCFCAVYENTQIHLLIEVLSSFGFSFITPLIIYLIPGIFRIPSLKDGKESNNPLLYKLSLILQNLL